MVEFNGFDNGVIGKRLPADTTLNRLKKSELIELLHLAEYNHDVLAKAYQIAVDNSKCHLCPLELDKRRADGIRAEAIYEFANWLAHNRKYNPMKGDIGFAWVDGTHFSTVDETIAEYEGNKRNHEL